MLSVCRDWLRRSWNDTGRHNVSFIYFCHNELKLLGGAPQLSQRRTRGKSTYRGEQGSCCKLKAFWWFYLIEHTCLLSKWHCKHRQTGMVSPNSKLIMRAIRTKDGLAFGLEGIYNTQDSQYVELWNISPYMFSLQVSHVIRQQCTCIFV